MKNNNEGEFKRYRKAGRVLATWLTIPGYIEAVIGIIIIVASTYNAVIESGASETSLVALSRESLIAFWLSGAGLFASGLVFVALGEYIESKAMAIAKACEILEDTSRTLKSNSLSGKKNEYAGRYADILPNEPKTNNNDGNKQFQENGPEKEESRVTPKNNEFSRAEIGTWKCIRCGQTNMIGEICQCLLNKEESDRLKSKVDEYQELLKLGIIDAKEFENKKKQIIG